MAIQEFINPFKNLFISVAGIIDDFEHKPIYTENDINISNWITQVISNEDFEHVVHVKGKLNGKIFSYKTLAKFNPATMKGNANNYQKAMRTGKFLTLKNKVYSEFSLTQYSEAVCTLLAYILGWLLLGKPLATVNMARGKIFLEMIEFLKITELIVVVDSIALGGNKPRCNIEVSQEELMALANFHVLRSNRILSRENSSVASEESNNSVSQNTIESEIPFQL